MRISPLNNISFQKKLVATCSYRTPKGFKPARIYQLEDIPEDKDYFEKLEEKKDWKNGQYFLYSLDHDMNNGYAEGVYVLENNKNNCLGYVETFNSPEDRLILEFIETKPSHRALSYIGETLVNFVSQLAKQKGKKRVHVIYPESHAKGFYKKCGFKNDETIGMNLMCDDMDELAKRNFEHTKSEINFL